MGTNILSFCENESDHRMATLSHIDFVEVTEKEWFKEKYLVVPPITPGLRSINDFLSKSSMSAKIMVVYDRVKNENAHNYFCQDEIPDFKVLCGVTKETKDVMVTPVSKLGMGAKTNAKAKTKTYSMEKREIQVQKDTTFFKRFFEDIKVHDSEEAFKHLTTPKHSQDVKVYVVLTRTDKVKTVGCGFGSIEPKEIHMDPTETPTEALLVHPDCFLVDPEYRGKKYCKVMVALITSIAFRMSADNFTVCLWTKGIEGVSYDYDDVRGFMEVLGGKETFEECDMMVAPISAAKFNEVGTAWFFMLPSLSRRLAYLEASEPQ